METYSCTQIMRPIRTVSMFVFLKRKRKTWNHFPFLLDVICSIWVCFGNFWGSGL